MTLHTRYLLSTNPIVLGAQYIGHLNGTYPHKPGTKRRTKHHFVHHYGLGQPNFLLVKSCFKGTFWGTRAEADAEAADLLIAGVETFVVQFVVHQP